MKKIFIVIIFLSNSLIAQDSLLTDASVFVDKCLEEYKYLIELTDSSVKSKWIKLYDQSVQKFIETSQSLSKTEKYLKENNAYDSTTFPTTYLNSVYEIQLSDYSKLVNNLGQSVFEHYYARKVQPIMDNIYNEIENIKLDLNNSLINKAFVALNELNKRIEKNRINPSVKYRHVYTFRNTVYSEPFKIMDYKIINWRKYIYEVSDYQEQLSEIRSDIMFYKKISPADPIYFIPLLIQLTILMITIPGYILTFTDYRPKKLIFFMTIASMLISFILIFFNDNTFINVAIQIWVPLIFIYIWYRGKKVSITSSSSRAL